MRSETTKTRADLRDLCRNALDASRHRMLDVVGVLTDAELETQQSPLMSPVVWDLAHVGNYEELWLLHNVTGEPTTSARLDDLYNAFEHPRWERPSLPILTPSEARTYISEVRRRAFAALDEVDFASQRELLENGFVYGMVAQHEHQHIETVLATLQLSEKPIEAARRADSSAAHSTATAAAGEVHVSAGRFVMGSDAAWAYDNERPAHEVFVDDFWIDTMPVTNAAYMEFIGDAGYDNPGLWSTEGWAWRQEAGLEAPEFWARDGDGGWDRVRFGHREEVPLGEPVQHVCWYEADAFSRWAGRRLPTEPEWEKAAKWSASGDTRAYPWGNEPPTPAVANLAGADVCRYAPAPVGTYPEGVSPAGCHQMLGDVWEWTSTDFGGYPGFRAWPYAEYSEVFFGDEYKVLRGGAWATHPAAIRAGFRNWDYPIRRQIFAGFRTARSG